MDKGVSASRMHRYPEAAAAEGKIGVCPTNMSQTAEAACCSSCLNKACARLLDRLLALTRLKY